jgi:tetratricopeptide (TPR) repeat protein
METSLEMTREIFIECNWNYDVSPEKHYGYSSVMSCLQKSAKEMDEAGRPNHAKVLELLSRAASMMLRPNSLNEPFTAYFQDFQAGRRSSQPEDFTAEELIFFETILNDIDELWLKARLADLLWLLRKPKNPEHAKIAIDSYVSNPIDSEMWHRDVRNGWERAARLCMQIRDSDRLEGIKNNLFSAFCAEHPRSKFMTLWVADLLDQLKIDRDFKEDIASSLFEIALELKHDGDFHSARSYFELAAKKYQQCSEEQGWLDAHIAIADCFELEGDSRSAGSNMVANSFYENAIQAYRRIPNKNRVNYDVESRISAIRHKINDSGRASLDEMALIETPGVDVSEIAKSSMAHVAGKSSPEEALMYLSGLFAGPKYQELASSAKEIMQESIFSSLAGSSHMSSDGRVVAKTPPMNLKAGEDDPANKAVLNRQVQQQFSFEVQLVVEGQILPALRQLLMEHRFTRELLVAACYQSPIVSKGREKLLGYALWLGFEYEFGAAIHLICPQVEHVVRTQLKASGFHTSTIDKDGIENENGLSTLMDSPEAIQVFGENLTFEIKSVFTEAIGFNLRNETAHGLLDDNVSASLSAIYAWWMVLRLVLRSIVLGGIKGD